MGIKLGLIGCGSFGRAFAPLFKNHPSVDSFAICDSNPEALNRMAEDPFFSDKLAKSDIYAFFEEILQSDVDAVAIITQPWLHAPQAIAAMEAGKHVYSAVPVITLPDMDETLDWCDRIIATSARTGMRYMLGETTIFRPETMYCRRLAEEGRFGTFVYAEGEYMHDVDANCNLRDVRDSRLSSPVGKEWPARLKTYTDRGLRSSPMSYPTHSVGGPVHVMKAHAVKALGIGYRNQTGDEYFADDEFSNVVGLYQMSNGATCRICEFREAPGHLGGDPETFRLVGTAGTWNDGHQFFAGNKRLTGGRVPPPQIERPSVEEMRDPLPDEVRRAFIKAENRDFSEEEVLHADFTPKGHGGSHPYLVHEFVSSVVDNRQPVTNAWEAGRYMAMGAIAHQSALRDSEWLEVPDWGDAP